MLIIESAVHYRRRGTNSVNLGSMMFPDEVGQETSNARRRISWTAIIQEKSSKGRSSTARRLLGRLLSPARCQRSTDSTQRTRGQCGLSSHARSLVDAATGEALAVPFGDDAAAESTESADSWQLTVVDR